MAELIPINIIIADRSYRIKVDPKDEEVVRKTVKIINDKVIEYKTQFAGKDMQDYLGMVVIWYATTQAGSGSIPVATELSQQLLKLEALLDKAV
ncbi:MAG: cell division protein ZapA [Sphingobacteriales bacterium]|nr:MAG: cell division protein ZapA [Sphingobacteriales bacterium]